MKKGKRRRQGCHGVREKGSEGGEALLALKKGAQLLKYGRKHDQVRGSDLEGEVIVEQGGQDGYFSLNGNNLVREPVMEESGKEKVDQEECMESGRSSETFGNKIEEAEVVEGGAIWDIFRRQDVPKLQDYLKKQFREFRYVHCCPVSQELGSRVSFLSVLSLTYLVMAIRYGSMKRLAPTAVLATLFLSGLRRTQPLLTLEMYMDPVLPFQP
ncbi:hypothetical protein REPUB_Repub04eG0099400 [Reevesia pubescens]